MSGVIGIIAGFGFIVYLAIAGLIANFLNKRSRRHIRGKNEGE